MSRVRKPLAKSPIMRSFNQMKPRTCQKLDVVNLTQSNPENVRGWRSQFTPECAVEDLRAIIGQIFSPQNL